MGDVVRLKGFDFSGNNAFIFFDSSQNYLFGNRDIKPGGSGTTAVTGQTIGSATISNNRIATYTYTDNADSTIAYIGISGTCTDGANAFATLNEDLPV